VLAQALGDSRKLSVEGRHDLAHARAGRFDIGSAARQIAKLWGNERAGPESWDRWCVCQTAFVESIVRGSSPPCYRYPARRVCGSGRSSAIRAGENLSRVLEICAEPIS
jgi:hypothetical protein